MTMIFGLGVLLQVGMMWSEAARVDKVDVVAVLQDQVQLSGAYGIAVAGDYAYVTGQFDDGVSVLNIADPTSPAVVGSWSIKDNDILDYPQGIAVRGDYAYVSGYYDFVSFNIADPSNVTIVSSVRDSALLLGLHDVVLEGNYAYVSSSFQSSFVVFDITDPTNLTVAGSIKDSTLLYSGRGIDIVGDLAYMVTSNSNLDLAVFNISDPSSPTPVGLFNSGGQMDGASRIAVVGNRAYVTAQGPKALVVLDITDLSNIAIHSMLSNVTLLDQPMGLEIVGNYAYVSTLHGVVTVDISDPSSLAIVGNVQITDDLSDSNTFAHGRTFAVVGNRAYVACNNGFMHRGVAVIDISTPTNLNEVAFFGENPHSSFEEAAGVKVDGNFAYVVGDEGSLTVVDVSNPHRPSVVSSIWDQRLDGAEGLAMAGDYAYVASNDYDGLVAVHIADKANLTIAGFLQDGALFDGATDVAIAGSYAFVTAYSDDAVTAVDISDPNNLTVASHFTDGALDGAENIVIGGNFAYVTAYAEDSLTIVDITDPYNMNVAGTIRDTRLDQARGLAVVGDYAYVACHNTDGFAAINITDPSNPTIAGLGAC